jgi:Uma2 family endonuclease
MAALEPRLLPPGLDRPPPTEDELPYDDGVPMESEQHLLQMNLLIETLRLYWKERPLGYVGGNMGVYFHLEQAERPEYKAPDFFAVVDGVKRLRKSWVVWQERLGPDVVIELLSDSTRTVDKGKKKRVYQDELRVPEYFWYDPLSGELAGFRLVAGRYRPIEPDAQGRLRSERLELLLSCVEGTRFQGVEATWLRWMTAEGQRLPTEHEIAEHERQRAEQAEARARQLEEELQRLRAEGDPRRG